jgi:hypothetical protein
VATKPDSEHNGKTVTQAVEHSDGTPSGRPEDWGWHAEWGRASRVGGWISIGILLLLITTTHYNGQGTAFLILFAAVLFVLLLRDRNRRKTSWRQ